MEMRLVVNPFTKYPFSNIIRFSAKKGNKVEVESRYCSLALSLSGDNYNGLKKAATYALTMSPVAMSLEELIPSNQSKSHMYAILIRTALVISTLLVGLTVPFFGLVMALIGSLLTMLVTLILPCACFLSILRGKITRFQGSLCILIIAVGVVSSAFGTYSALAKIIEKLS
ncbi:Amino acid transporter AVT1B [Vitis vinifera]|uniref:Amino acid transporter AVT1B n=1 Tax=Vitis vinifera TaxID=29760 RepID=A0A438CWE9_VITVI|nr:Amino acid transporter AVT1B [Vitis vinifera]